MCRELCRFQRCLRPSDPTLWTEMDTRCFPSETCTWPNDCWGAKEAGGAPGAKGQGTRGQCCRFCSGRLQGGGDI